MEEEVGDSAKSLTLPMTFTYRIYTMGITTNENASDNNKDPKGEDKGKMTTPPVNLDHQTRKPSI